MSQPGIEADRPPERAIGRIESLFVRANRAVIVVMMVVMVALVFTNAVSRYVFSYSIVWAEELTQYLMVWIVFIGAGLAFREGRHVAVEVFQDRLPARPRLFVRKLILALLVLFLLALTALGLRYVMFAAGQETPVMNISYSIPYLCMPVGAVLFLIHLWQMRREYLDGRYEIPESLEAFVDEER